MRYSLLILCTVLMSWMLASCGADAQEHEAVELPTEEDPVSAAFSREDDGTYIHLASGTMLPRSWEEWMRIEDSLQVDGESGCCMSVSYRMNPPKEAVLSMEIFPADKDIYAQFEKINEVFSSSAPDALLLSESLEDDMCFSLYLSLKLEEDGPGLFAVFLFLFEQQGWFTSSRVDLPADLEALTDMEYVTGFLMKLPFFSIEETPYFTPARTPGDSHADPHDS